MARPVSSAKKAKTASAVSGPVKREQQYTHVDVERQFDVNLRRIKLPACMMEQEIVDAIKYNDVVVITGDTGCGKSTQVPQFLYENGFCVGNSIIGVTQVRRVACLALYQQVSLELNSKTLVGYQYRFNKGYNQKLCKIKFMTDGILLQEIKDDILCTRYSVLIIDEAHERNLNCDLLIGILARVVQVRREHFESGESVLPPLKLVIMSATIRAEDFLEAKIFKGHVTHCHIPTEFKRNTIHFARRSVRDYVADAYDKVLKIHQRLPPGSVLVFLTGKDELFRLKRLLAPHERTTASERTVPPPPPAEEPNDDDAVFDIESDDSEDEVTSSGNSNSDDTKDAGDSGGTVPPNAGGVPSKESHGTPTIDKECQEIATSLVDEGLDAKLDTTIKVNEGKELQNSDSKPFTTDSYEDDGGSVVDLDPCNDTAGRLWAGESDDETSSHSDNEYHVELDVLSKSYKRLSDIKWHGAGSGSGRLRVVAMHASQTMDAQMAAFTVPNDNERMVILSTNVAETAITLPNIRYVVDCGKEKRRVDDIQRGVSRFVICDISKASANQRAGRAGRVGRGHCYRQYTSSVYDTLFDENSPTEISNCNLEFAILLLSSMGIENPYDFQFLTPPPQDNIRCAMQVLAVLGAIETPRKPLVERYSLHNEVTTNPFKIQPVYPYRSSFDVMKELRVARITQLGQYLCLLPLHPRFGKMLYCVLSKGGDALALRTACCVISALSFGVANLVAPRVPGDDPERKALPSLRSDIEVFMWLCCRYSQLEKDAASLFCRQYGVNERLLREVFQQAEQVHRAILTSIGSAMNNLEVDWTQPLGTPRRSTKQIIESAIVECMVDKVAVRVQQLSGEAHDAAANAYRTGALASMGRDVFLPRPYSRHKPECVVYAGLVGDEKVKMQDVLPTDAATLCTLRSPLIVADSIRKHPAPRYDHELDYVEAFVHRMYAPLEFPLGVAKSALNPDHPLATRVFAHQFCFGHIFPILRQFEDALTVGIDDFMAPTKVSGPLGTMLLTLRRNRVASKASFLEKYRQSDTFLMSEFHSLLREGSFDDQMATAEDSAQPSVEGNLGERLRMRDSFLQPFYEFCIGLSTYTSRRNSPRQPDTDLLMDFVILHPVRALIFVQGAIFCGVMMNAMLYIPDLAVKGIFKHSTSHYDSMVWWWLAFNKVLQMLQMPIRIFLLYVLRSLRGATNQEIMYCMSVLTTCRLWRWSKRLTLTNYFWYALGFAASRNPVLKSKPWFNTMVIYVFAVIALRVMFTFTLFYYAFPPSRVRITKKPAPKIDFGRIPVRRYCDCENVSTSMCGICLDEFESEDRLRVLLCNHGYHVACIDKWFARSNTCPLCMALVD
ncbi:ATP-dependent RNA helicase DEAH13 [Babesia sp. Xinjiang]|uniref:ATP-dependent RNA helicase DEAH13 n=1 Tax=Babesia sp. Xinjiang TaxID=462227 RepID=UPI000A25F73D|nr:ATP-dependent RNA helicase DEAH13 [Babesia sp. Xinjiang]ORM39460.1 ATP-dependent RNA helicase DEAH13 [Babesia sp. Xinjiang]